MWVYQENNAQTEQPAGQNGAAPAAAEHTAARPVFSDEAAGAPVPRAKPAVNAVRQGRAVASAFAAASARRSAPPAKHTAAADRPTPEHPSEAENAETAHIKAPALRRKSGHATRDCLLLGATYLFGACLSGVMQSLCEAKELETLAYYLGSWGALFTLQDAKSALALFGAQYFSAMGAVTVLLLFGLCAFGPVLIFLFTMLYGVGTGIVSLQLFLQQPLPQYAGTLLFWGAPAAAMAGCLCFFGASALQVSLRLQNTAFGQKRGVPVASSAKLLLGQYILIGILLLPICGIAAALLYLFTGL